MLGSRRLRSCAVLGLSLFALAGCTSSRQSLIDPDLPAHLQFGRDSRGKIVTQYKVGTPYEVAGQWYYPAEDYGYREEGIASWYGPGFHGKRTANGEVYDMNALTAAHKTLPMPSVVNVTNLENGRALKVRINDRGPFVEGRIIDLSRRAAQLLDVEKKGTARVRVEIIPDDSLTLKNIALDASGGPPLPAPPVTAAPREPVVAQTLEPPISIGISAPAVPVPVVAATVTPSVPTPDLPSLPTPGGSAPPAPPAVTASVPNAPASPGVPTPPTQMASVPPGTPLPTPSDPTITAATLPPPASLEPPGQVVVAPPINLPTGVFIQAGAFTDLNNARRLEAQLSGWGNVFVAMVEISGRMFHRVRLGPIPDRAVADQLLEQMRSQGYGEARIVED